MCVSTYISWRKKIRSLGYTWNDLATLKFHHLNTLTVSHAKKELRFTSDLGSSWRLHQKMSPRVQELAKINAIC